MTTSERTVAQKLMIKEGQRFLVLNQPNNYKQALGKLPNKVILSTEPKVQHDVVQLFVTSRKELEQRPPKAKSVIQSKGIVWVTYPKGTSSIKADINRDSIRECADTIGLEAVALFSVDKDWSALRVNQTTTRKIERPVPSNKPP